jgi:hypothetical protein
LVQELFSKTDPTRFRGNNKIQSRTRIYLPSYELKKSKEQGETLVTPKEPCKMFKEAIETLSNSKSNLCNKRSSNFDFLTKRSKLRLVWHLS